MSAKNLLKGLGITLCAAALLLAWLVGAQLAAPVAATRSAVEGGWSIRAPQSLSSADAPVPIVSDPANQHQHVMAEDGAGGAIVTWTDTRVPPTDTVSVWWEGETVIYAQRVLSSGNALWEMDGIPVVDLSRPISQVFYLHSQPAVVADGVGGAVIGFLNEAGDSPGVYVQRINEQGEMVWRDRYRYGHEIANMDENLMDILVMASDGAEGAIVVWGLYTDKGGRLYAQRIGKGGDKLWDSSVPLFTNYQNDTAFDPRVVSDGSGGAIIVWSDYRSGAAAGIYAQRLNKDGNRLWGVDGVPVAINASDDILFKPQVGIAADSSGGAFITWDTKAAGKTRVVAQYLDENGDHHWPASVLLSDHMEPDSSVNSDDPAITQDGAGGVYVVWRRQPPVSIRAHRLSPDGTLLWGDIHTRGLNLSTDTACMTAESASIVPDGEGGAFVVWECISSAGMEFHQKLSVQHLNSSGSVLCGAAGGEIADIREADTDVALVPGQTQRVIAAWKDLPDFSFEDRFEIYAQLANAACVAGWQGEPDVMVRDNEHDSGDVPSSTPWWNSPDVWVRNRHDFVEEHQNPLSGQENTIYVRIKNRGKTTAKDVEVVVYHSTPRLGLAWPDDWTEIISTSISTLDPQASHIAVLPWTPPTSGFVSLLVQVAAQDDPVTFVGDVPGDNNIAHKNVDIIRLGSVENNVSEVGGPESTDISESPDGFQSPDVSESAESIFTVSNPQGEAAPADVVIELEALASGGALSLDLGVELFDRWEAAGGELHGAEILTGSTRISVTSPISAAIIGLPLESGESSLLTATVKGPPTDANWLYINIWERMAGEAVGGLVLRAPVIFDLAGSVKKASIFEVTPGGIVTYTLILTNQGNLDHPAVSVMDTIPLLMTVVGDSLAWSAGEGAYADGTVSWIGPVSLTQPTTITYLAGVGALASDGQIITNSAIVDDSLNPITELSAVVQVVEVEMPAINQYLPLVHKGR